MSLKAWDELGILKREILLYKKLSNYNFKITLFTYGDTQEHEYFDLLMPINIYPAYPNSTPPKTIFGRLFSALIIPFKHYNFFKNQDILKTNQMWGAWVPLMVKWLTGKILLVRCGYEQHQLLKAQKNLFLKRWFYYWLSKRVYKSGDAILLTSQTIADYVQSVFGISSRKITVISNAINTELFSFVKIDMDDPIKVLAIGRLNHEKILFNLIKACHETNTTLTLVGSGELESQLKVYVKKLGAKVTFTGNIPNNEIPAILHSHPIYIISSHHEGNPKSLLEAMSTGRAVIGTNVPGIRNIISHKINGLLCGTEADQIAGAINILKNDIKLQQTLGKSVRQYVVNNCSIEIAVETELNIYKSLLI